MYVWVLLRKDLDVKSSFPAARCFWPCDGWFKPCLPDRRVKPQWIFQHLCSEPGTLMKTFDVREKMTSMNRECFQVVLARYRTLSQGSSCGSGLGGTDGRGSSGILRLPEDTAAPQTTSASLTVTVEVQTEPASSASPPTAEW